jgi:hypothetical protein
MTLTSSTKSATEFQLATFVEHTAPDANLWTTVAFLVELSNEAVSSASNVMLEFDTVVWTFAAVGYVRQELVDVPPGGVGPVVVVVPPDPLPLPPHPSAADVNTTAPTKRTRSQVIMASSTDQ